MIDGRGAAEPTGRWVWVDLRLVPVAATVWGTSLLASPLTPGLLAVTAAISAAFAVATARRTAGGVSSVVLALLAGIAVSAAAGAVRGAMREASPMHALAAAERTVDVVLELDGDPRVLPGAGASRVIAPATVLRLDEDGSRRHVSAAVLLFAPADRGQHVPPGQPVRVRVATALPGHGDHLAAILSARGPPTPLGRPGWLQRTAGDLRAGLADSAARTLEPRLAGLLPGLTVGDTSAMDPVLTEDFRRAGLAHLTAVSGWNVG